MEILKGAASSARIKEEAASLLAAMEGPAPKLAIVRVGERPDDLSYERGATKKLESFGLRVQSFAYPADISHEEFMDAFAKINRDEDVAGILLLCPLPTQIDQKTVAAVIDPLKDLDGISPVNAAKVFTGDPEGFAPCTAEAVMEVLKTAGIGVRGKRVVIVGRSMVVGRPLSMLMLKEDATVTICHTKTADLRAVCKEADILAAAAGKARMLDESYIRDGAVVIDVGINVDENGALCGDVDFQSLEGKAAAATPVPGGVGTVTTAVLARHLLAAARAKAAVKKA